MRRVLVVAVVLTLFAACTNRDVTQGPTNGPTPSPTPSPTLPPEPVPSALADGSSLPEVPVQPQPSLEKPLVSAALLGEDSPIVRSCKQGKAISREGDFQYGMLSSRGATVSFVGSDDEGRRLLACDGVWAGSDWSWCSSVSHPWREERDFLARSGGGLTAACRESDDAYVAFVWVPVPEGASWLIQDEGSFWTLYPVPDGLPVRIAGRGIGTGSAGFSALVRFLDRIGSVLEEREVRGDVAG